MPAAEEVAGGGERAERWQPRVRDGELAALLAAEIARDGGRAELNALPTYNPAIRRLLGDRKLRSAGGAPPRARPPAGRHAARPPARPPR